MQKIQNKKGGKFEFQVEEQKNVRVCGDMTNLSRSSEKNVPLMMIFGIKSAPGYFQSIMDQLTSDLPDVTSL